MSAICTSKLAWMQARGPPSYITIGSFIAKLARHIGYTPLVPMFVIHHVTLMGIGYVSQQGNDQAFIDHTRAPHQDVNMEDQR